MVCTIVEARVLIGHEKTSIRKSGYSFFDLYFRQTKDINFLIVR